MFKSFKAVTFFLLLGTIVVAQKKKDKVLLKIDNERVYASEFSRLFEKNKSLKAQGTKPNINDDIQLFVDYKLKIIEAHDLKMDTIPSYKREVAKYRKQLIEPYLYDDSFIDSLVKEAYERSLIEVRASHILVLLDKNATDTIAAYEKIASIRESIIAGADFAKVARNKSEGPSGKKTGGDLGYFSVFRMVYPFESAAFTTPKGEVSKIFRTQFGYHIIKVTDTRKALGEMEVAHIMIRDTTSVGASSINKVYKMLINDGSFEELAKKYSDDKRSSDKGGRLNRFTLEAFPVPFGEKSFALSEENIYSEPFKTAYGWHIVKYINYYPVGSFEDSKESLLAKTKKDSRSKTLSNPVVLKLKKKYKIVINQAAKKEFEDLNFKVMDSLNSWLIVIQKDTLTQKNFSEYNSRRDEKPMAENFKTYLDKEVLEYYKIHLEETDEGFKNLFLEYKNGLLLFDLMKSEIWDAAQNDSIGLQNYYALHKSNYNLPETFHSVVVSTKDSLQVASLKELVSQADSIKVVENRVQDMENVLLKSGDFDKNNGIFPKNVQLDLGTTSVCQEGGYFIIVKVFSKTEELEQNLEDIKGLVISDFQNEIQEKWLADLRSKHKVKIYKRTVKKLTSQMELYSE